MTQTRALQSHPKITFEVNCYTDKEITDVLLPLTDAEWCACCMRDRDMYMGGCCGKTSAAQDILNNIFRNNGWAEAEKLQEFCLAMIEHDDVHGGNHLDPISNPIHRIIAIFLQIKDELKVENWLKTMELETIHDVMNECGSICRFDFWQEHFIRHSEGEEKEALQLHSYYDHARLAPLLTRLVAMLAEEQPREIIAYAILSGNGNRLAETNHGTPAIYRKVEQAFKIYKLIPEKHRGQFNIHRVEISYASGMKILEAVEIPQ
jgi:hypothetical protein